MVSPGHNRLICLFVSLLSHFWLIHFFTYTCFINHILSPYKICWWNLLPPTGFPQKSQKKVPWLFHDFWWFFKVPWLSMTFPENFIFPGFPGFPDPVGTLTQMSSKPLWHLEYDRAPVKYSQIWPPQWHAPVVNSLAPGRCVSNSKSIHIQNSRPNSVFWYPWLVVKCR